MKTFIRLSLICLLLTAAIEWPLASAQHAALPGAFEEAVTRGDLVRVKRLVSNDPSLVIAVNTDGYTPLHFAAASGNRSVLDYLLLRKASINAVTSAGDTPLLCAAMNGRDETGVELISKGADVKVRDKNGVTPLHRAANTGSVQIVKALLVKGADARAKDSSGRTPRDHIEKVVTDYKTNPQTSPRYRQVIQMLKRAESWGHKTAFDRVLRKTEANH